MAATLIAKNILKIQVRINNFRTNSIKIIVSLPAYTRVNGKTEESSSLKIDVA
ncbi:MAG: hypothetical protein WC780_15405 [Lentimicrobiaceae bacterium]|jgi:hypothetical protein